MSDERFADDLDPGVAVPSARAGRVRDLLASEAMWAAPDADLEESLVAFIARSRPTELRPDGRDSRRSSLLWLGSAAVLALVLALGVFAWRDAEPDPEGIGFALEATELGGGAVASGQLISTEAGYAIRLDIDGLAPAPAGSFYEGWVRGDEGSVSVGTFHMRGQAPIGLWSGVDVAEYHTLNITIQEEGAGPQSSGLVVLTGELPGP